MSRAVIWPSTTASTCSAMGASTPVARARASSDAGLRALGDLAGRGVDLLGGHAPAELLAERPVARQRRRAGRDQVAQPGQAHQGQRVGAEAMASRAVSARPRVITEAVVLSPNPSPTAMPTARPTTFL